MSLRLTNKERKRNADILSAGGRDARVPEHFHNRFKQEKRGSGGEARGPRTSPLPNGLLDYAGSKAK